LVSYMNDATEGPCVASPNEMSSLGTPMSTSMMCTSGEYCENFIPSGESVHYSNSTVQRHDAQAGTNPESSWAEHVGTCLNTPTNLLALHPTATVDKPAVFNRFYEFVPVDNVVVPSFIVTIEAEYMVRGFASYYSNGHLAQASAPQRAFTTVAAADPLTAATQATIKAAASFHQAQGNPIGVSTDHASPKLTTGATLSETKGTNTKGHSVVTKLAGYASSAYGVYKDLAPVIEAIGSLAAAA